MSRVLAAIAALALGVVLVDIAVAPTSGPFALAAVFEPYVLVLGAVVGLLAALRTVSERGGSAGWIRILGVAVVIVAVVRVGGEWWSPEPDPAGDRDGATRITVRSWNLEDGSKGPAETVAGILDAPRDGAPDIVALQELTPDAALALETSAEIKARYPYRILEPRDGVLGMGILSTLPLVRGVYGAHPMLLTADVLLEGAAPLRLIDAHPFPPRIDLAFGIVPVGIDTRLRDGELEGVRAAIDAADDPARVLVVGDLNTTPFEGGFRIVAGGLHDAHADAGVGTGFTWRPSALEGLDAGFLRIDYVLTGDALVPVATSEDCSLPGDHCRLTVTLELAGP